MNRVGRPEGRALKPCDNNRAQQEDSSFLARIQPMKTTDSLFPIFPFLTFLPYKNFPLPLLCGNLHKPHLICTDDAK